MVGPELVECGCCGGYHRKGYDGDCRNDAERFARQHKPDEKLMAGYFNFSPIRAMSDNEILDPFFSSFACQTCGSTLAGDRHYCSATHGKAHAGPREKLEVCVDCFQFFSLRICICRNR